MSRLPPLADGRDSERQLHPPLLSPRSRLKKRQSAYDSLVACHYELLDCYPDLWIILPQAGDAYSKRGWEQACFKTRELLRVLQECQDSGNRVACRNFILTTYDNFFQMNAHYRQLLLDPADDILDSEWLASEIGVLDCSASSVLQQSGRRLSRSPRRKKYVH